MTNDPMTNGERKSLDIGALDIGSFLFLRHVVRERVSFEGLVRLIREAYHTWRPTKILIENEKLGQAAVDLLGKELPIVTTRTMGQDKVARATRLQVMLEQGQIWIPVDAPWRSTFESELLSWTGHPDETCDQIDAAAYAAHECESYAGPMQMQRIFRPER